LLPSIRYGWYRWKRFLRISWKGGEYCLFIENMNADLWKLPFKYF
jgi:hypothetical protein